MSLGMFSAIPVPKNSWNDKYMPLCVPCLPVVGVVLGSLWFGTAVFLQHVALPVMLRASVITVIPMLLSGFLHLDGYMDTSDAILSRRNLDEKRRILKDPHVGAFAAIMLAILLLFQFSSVYTVIMEEKELLALLFIPIISRCCAGLVLLKLKPMSETGFAAMFRAGTGPVHTVFIVFVMISALALTFGLSGIQALIVLLTETLAAVCVTAYVYRQIEGISGDLCGCIITVTELAGLLTLAIL